MEGITVHKLNDQLTVSLHSLPGFRQLGNCVIRGEDGKKSGMVPVYFTGNFFQTKLENGEYSRVSKLIMRLAQNHAVRGNLGRFATRLNLATSIRVNVKKMQKSQETNQLKDQQ